MTGFDRYVRCHDREVMQRRLRFAAVRKGTAVVPEILYSAHEPTKPVVPALSSPTLS